MPNLANAKKALRQDAKRRARNNTKRNAIASLRRQIRKLLEAKDVKGAEALVPKVQKELDKAVKVNLIKKNNAARTLSRIATSIKKHVA